MSDYVWTDEIYKASVLPEVSASAIKHSPGATLRDYDRLLTVLEQLSAMNETLGAYIKSTKRADIKENGSELISRSKDLLRDHYHFIFEGGSLDVKLNLRLAHEVKLGISSLFWE